MDLHVNKNGNVDVGFCGFVHPKDESTPRSYKGCNAEQTSFLWSVSFTWPCCVYGWVWHRSFYPSVSCVSIAERVEFRMVHTRTQIRRIISILFFYVDSECLLDFFSIWRFSFYASDFHYTFCHSQIVKANETYNKRCVN